MLCPFGPIFGPAHGSYVSRPVRQSVRLSVCPWQKFSYFLSLLFLIFCNMLACSKCRKVTKPDFRRKIRKNFLGPFMPKNEVFWGFWRFSRERVARFGWKFIYRFDGSLSTTFVKTVWRFLHIDGSQIKKYVKKWGFWPFSRERVISFGWNFIFW